jgi:hypothetical protein
MKKLFILGVLVIGTMSSWAQKQNPTYLAYIEEWKAIAIQEQEDYGIPASITMAQALLESQAGQSELAINAKNHFGIKCTSEWFGGVYYHDDDKKNDCFRQYGNAAESFKDHSIFLKRPRYSTCFEIAVEDYEGWARRLKECGYATDPSYAPKLIKLIEDYRLDTLTVSKTVHRPQAEPADRAQKENAGTDSVAKPAPKPKRPLKATIVRRSEPIMVIHNDPEPPYVEPLTAKEERDSFFLMHPRKKCNGIQYVIAREEDTYANVAFRLNVRERDLREDRAWWRYSLPEAVIEVKQAAGRLIRTASDTGVLVLADSRLATKRYGRQFISSLPKGEASSLEATNVRRYIEMWRHTHE